MVEAQSWSWYSEVGDIKISDLCILKILKILKSISES